MLVIRNRQMESFELDSDFAIVSERIEKKHPHIPAGLDAAQFDSLVRLSLKKGKQYKVERVETVVIIAQFIFEVGARFDELPDVREVLDNEEHLPDEKFEILLLKQDLEDWKILYDAAF